jgi:hypothetical protein
MTAVWDHSTHEQGTLLVLLALADHAHDDGTGARPSNATIQKKSRLKERQVRYALRALEASGEIVPDGRHSSGATIYRIVLPGIGGQLLPGANTAPQQPTAPPPGNPVPLDPGSGVPPNRPLTVNEPSEPPLSPPKGKAKRAKAIDPVMEIREQMRSWAHEHGFTNADIERETTKFLDHFTANGKPMKDWDAAWRNWMRRSREFAPRASPNGKAAGLTYYEDPEEVRLAKLESERQRKLAEQRRGARA